MNLAPLQLVEYFLTDLSLQANPDFDISKPVGDCVESLEITPCYSQNGKASDHGTEWTVALQIKQTIPPGKNLPYAFSLGIRGTVLAFSVLSGAKLQRAIHANGPAMLFGAAREIIRGATGRGPWPAVIIPSTNFLAGLPPLELPAPSPVPQDTPPSKVAPGKRMAKKQSATK
jgi:preprotein translocase subunit SecB